MAKKKEDKHSSDTITVNKEEFKQTRDTFLSSFVVLQDAIRDLTSNYIKHTNTVLGDSGSNIDSVLKDLGEVAGAAAAAAGRSTSPAKSEPGKKERKKRVHDLNAPKRPLTAFFLYMQTARAIITDDLGPDAPKGAVSDEGSRRWKTMAAEDKESWARAYRDNMKLYSAKMHSYKAGNLAAKHMTDDEARVYYDNNLAGLEDHAAEAQLVHEALATDPDVDLEDEEATSPDADADGEADSEEEAAAPPKSPTPPPKTPKVKSSRKKAGAKTETPVVAPTPTLSSSQAAAPASEPEKKRKRKTKAETEKEKAETAKEKAATADAPVDSIEREELIVQTPAAPKSSKPKKKRAKNDA